MAPQASQSDIRRQFVPAAATTVAVGDEAMPLVGGPAQQTWQASQLGKLVPAVSAARQMTLDSAAVIRPDCAEEIDPQLETDVRARPGAGHGVLPRRERGRRGCLVSRCRFS